MGATLCPHSAAHGFRPHRMDGRGEDSAGRTSHWPCAWFGARVRLDVHFNEQPHRYRPRRTGEARLSGTGRLARREQNRRADLVCGHFDGLDLLFGDGRSKQPGAKSVH
jgi:hypothetical protein